MTGWRELSREEAVPWSEKLLQTEASVFQFPFWNTAFQHMHMRPRYLVYHEFDRPLAYVCILTARLLRWKIGLVQRGPVGLEKSHFSTAALRDLYEWARGQQFVFIRFSHSSSEFLDHLAAVMPCKRMDGFPFYQDLSDELLVSLDGTEEDILARFQPIARRKIRKAATENYVISFSEGDSEMVSVWPLFDRLAARKGFQFRPLASYLDVLRHANHIGAARVYTARLNNEAVEALFIVRDRSTAYYISGALDIAALEGRESPSCLLHWKAMKDFKKMGIKQYHLGSESVLQFKRQFRPRHVVNPIPLTVILNKPLYRVWQHVALRWAPSLRPILRRLINKGSEWFLNS